MSKNAASDKNYNLSEASEILGISKATVKNWVKLGKLPSISRNPYVFSKEELLAIHKKLDDSVYLKSRRNKTRSSDNYLPKSYIDSSSPNFHIIKSPYIVLVTLLLRRNTCNNLQHICNKLATNCKFCCKFLCLLL